MLHPWSGSIGRYDLDIYRNDIRVSKTCQGASFYMHFSQKGTWITLGVELYSDRHESLDYSVQFIPQQQTTTKLRSYNWSFEDPSDPEVGYFRGNHAWMNCVPGLGIHIRGDRESIWWRIWRFRIEERRKRRLLATILLPYPLPPVLIPFIV